MNLPVRYKELSSSEKRKVRELYISLQNGKCCYCKCDLNSEPPKNITNKPVDKKLFPVNFFDYPIHLHHNHNTGLTIGAIHCYCNAVSWIYDKI